MENHLLGKILVIWTGFHGCLEVRGWQVMNGFEVEMVKVGL